MEPQIQYAKTKDGVSIAYWTLGEGESLVLTAPLSYSHIELEWRSRELTRWYLRLADRRKIIRYDMRGYGLSQRDVTDLSLAAHVADVHAVADHLHLERFALLAIRGAGPIAIAFAASHPERVSRLVLWSCMARYSEAFAYQQHEMLEPMTDRNWEAYMETQIHMQLGWEHARAHELAQFIQASIRPDTYRAMIAASKDVDVSPLLGKIACPTLVLAGPDYPSPEATREIAASITNASLIPLEAGIHPAAGNTETVDAAIDEFLGGGKQPTTTAPAPPGLVTILFTDIESSTALTQRLGDAKAQEVVRAHNTIVRDALRQRGGSEIKHTGDGIMASFPSASGALECAVTIQRAVGTHNRGEAGGGRDPRPSSPDHHAEPVEAPLSIRIGLNAGEPVAEEQDLFGTAVQLASRICDRAAGGEIIASDVVRQLVAGKGFLFSDRGDTELRGFEEPVRLYECVYRR